MLPVRMYPVRASHTRTLPVSGLMKFTSSATTSIIVSFTVWQSSHPQLVAWGTLRSQSCSPVLSRTARSLDDEPEA